MSDKVAVHVVITFEVRESKVNEAVDKMLDVIMGLNCGAIRLNSFPEAKSVYIEAEFCKVIE